MRQATLHATNTDTAPEIITVLLALADSDQASAASPTDNATTSRDASNPSLQGSVRIPTGMPKEHCPNRLTRRLAFEWTSELSPQRRTA